MELAFSDVTNPGTEKVVTIPQDILEKGGTIRSADLPFKVQIKHFGVNCDLLLPPEGSNRGVLVQESIEALDRLPT